MRSANSRFSMNVFVLIVFLGFLSFKMASSQVFAPNIQVDDGVPYAQYAPSIARGLNDELYVMFDDMREGGDMYFAKSLDGGKSWTTPSIRVSDTCICDWGMHSRLVVDDAGVIYGAWTDWRRDDDGDEDYDIYFSRSTDGGETWSTNVRVNDSSDGSKVISSMIVAPDQSVCLVWADWRHGTSDIDVYFARSTDGGQTWTDPNIRVDDGRDGCQTGASLCADQEGNLYVGYSWAINSGRYHVYLVRSTDYGETWSKPAIRIDDGRVADHSNISLKVSTTGLYAVWRMYGAGMDNIVFSKSTDGGETWSRPVVQVDHHSWGLWSEEPDLAIGEDGTLYVTWVRWSVYDDGLPDVFFGMSTDDGQTWTNPSVRVNDIWQDSQRSSRLILGRDQTIFIVWHDSRNRTQPDPIDIYFTRTVPVLAYGEAVLDTVARGGNLEVTLTLINTTGYEHTADIWAGMALLKGGKYYGVDPAFGPQTFFLAPYDTLYENVKHEITEEFPLGEYEYWVKVDDEYPDYAHRAREVPRTHLFKDSFTFTVVEGRETGCLPRLRLGRNDSKAVIFRSPPSRGQASRE
jgi:hypothetical protein